MNCLLFSAEDKSPEQLALEAGIPVKVRNGEHFVKVNQATYDYLVGPHAPELLELLCECRSFRFPHKPSVHRTLRADYDWRLPEERGAIYREEL